MQIWTLLIKIGLSPISVYEYYQIINNSIKKTLKIKHYKYYKILNDLS